MKKLLSIGLLTVCALAISEQQASAWVNSRFSIGLNWHHQSANTSYLWGLWRNGQIPGPEAFGPGGPGGAPGMGGPGGFPGGPGGPGGQPFPFLGAGLQNGQPQQGGAQLGAFQQGGFQPGMQPGFQPGMQPGFQPVMPQGYYPQGYYPQWAPQQLPPSMLTETAPPPVQKMTQQSNYNPYQAVSYQQNSHNYGYYQPNYYSYPTYGYEVPYYWYGAR